jgi:translation elongation factor aEF-1 beta
MAKVLVSIKIFPSDVTTDLNQLKKKIEKELPKYASVYKFAEEPIAFGLIALIAHIIIPEEKPGGLDEVEKQLQKIDEISQIETLMVRRIS